MRKKFTLIELLIVIAVIAILLALLLPALQSAKQKVYTASCVNSMRQIGQAIYLYINDNNDYPPAPYEWANYMLNGNYIPSRNTTKLYGSLAVFKIRHLMICPMLSSVADSHRWPADQVPVEWSITCYSPAVTYQDWAARYDTYMIHTGGDMAIGGNPAQKYTAFFPMQLFSVTWHTAAIIPIITIPPTHSGTMRRATNTTIMEQISPM